ncbi:hypothetical protein [Halosimplex halobium]|uniref:hypothetical protein n=1 Tax=Halosimplex halobium TaxID=3396618 RepID=UPI003F57A9D4
MDTAHQKAMASLALAVDSVVERASRDVPDDTPPVAWLIECAHDEPDRVEEWVDKCVEDVEWRSAEYPTEESWGRPPGVCFTLGDCEIELYDFEGHVYVDGRQVGYLDVEEGEFADQVSDRFDAE